MLFNYSGLTAWSPERREREFERKRKKKRNNKKKEEEKITNEGTHQVDFSQLWRKKRGGTKPLGTNR